MMLYCLSFFCVVIFIVFLYLSIFFVVMLLGEFLNCFLNIVSFLVYGFFFVCIKVWMDILFKFELGRLFL